MGHNNVVSGHTKSTGISRVDELSTGPPDLRRHNFFSLLSFPFYFFITFQFQTKHKPLFET